jgi:hypothetical protein
MDSPGRSFAGSVRKRTPPKPRASPSTNRAESRIRPSAISKSASQWDGGHEKRGDPRGNALSAQARPPCPPSKKSAPSRNAERQCAEESRSVVCHPQR